MSFGSFVRCVVISAAASLVFFLVSVRPAQVAPRDGDDPIGKVVRQRQGNQPAEYEVPPHPIDLAPNAKQNPALAQCLELRAWADKVEFRQLEPVEIHYEYRNVSKDQVLTLSGNPDGVNSLEVEVTTADRLMPKTVYATRPRMVAMNNQSMVQPFQIPPLSEAMRRAGWEPAAFKGTLVVNLMRDMTNPGRYQVTLVLPVYNPELSAKAEARSGSVAIQVVKRPAS
jgi:hypothetical protein